jgi:hypothetical protein
VGFFPGMRTELIRTNQYEVYPDKSRIQETNNAHEEKRTNNEKTKTKELKIKK